MVWSKRDSCPKVTWEQVEIRRYRDDLYALPLQVHEALPPFLSWNLAQPLEVPGVGVLRYKLVKEQGIEERLLCGKNLTVRFREQGERCHPAGRQGSHPLKKLMQEWGIPPWQRGRVPLIYRDEQLVAVVGHCVAKPFAATKDEFGWVITLDS